MKSPPVPALKKDEQSTDLTQGKPAPKPRISGPRGTLLSLQRTIGNRAVGRLLRSGVMQAKLRIGQSSDRYEQEADRVADAVMRVPESHLSDGVAASDQAVSARRLPTECEKLHGQPEEREEEEEAGKEEILQTKACSSPSPESSPGRQARIHGLRGRGQPLPASVRAFFEPRLGHDFSRVAIHTDKRAVEASRALNARAFTVGQNVVFGEGAFAPGTAKGKKLLAHELTHVLQQSAAASAPGQYDISSEPDTIRRQTIDASCAGHERALNEAWAEAILMLSETISTLGSMRRAMTYEGGPLRLMPRQARYILNTFGDVGSMEGGGGFTTIGRLIERFQRIQGGFAGGKTLRCDVATVPNNDCDWRSAFVVVGNRTDIFLCPNFFEADVSVTERAATLIHEMAHSVLNATHEGIPERTYPPAFFDCDISLELEFDQAIRNAFAYEILVNCLHGSRPSSTVTASPGASRAATPEAAAHDMRWSVSASGGITLLPELQGLASLGSRVSLRTGPLVVFNPSIGLNVLYGPSTETRPEHLLAAVADIGLRIQQPVRGAYLDIQGGGFFGFNADPERSPTFTGGLSAALGAGWRWQRIELGAETRLLFPLTASDPTRVLILGRAALRF